MEIRNAKITGTKLGREDHGIMTFMIFVEFCGCACGIGGYALDEYDRETKKECIAQKAWKQSQKYSKRWELTTGKTLWANT